ncbi:hypothetical protein MTO96_051333 [Rhipicephalus appendiculatus]
MQQWRLRENEIISYSAIPALSDTYSAALTEYPKCAIYFYLLQGFHSLVNAIKFYFGEAVTTACGFTHFRFGATVPWQHGQRCGARTSSSSTVTRGVHPHGVRRTSPGQKKRRFDLIKKYREQIVSGQSTFEELASKYSDCSSAQRKGDLGFFARGAMQKPFEDCAFDLRVGELSDPVFTDSGVHLIMCTAAA